MDEPVPLPDRVVSALPWRRCCWADTVRRAGSVAQDSAGGSPLHHQPGGFRARQRGKTATAGEVVETTRALKLVTLTIDTRVRTKVRDERWRGSASAVVEAPVRYVYGVDLAELIPMRFASVRYWACTKLRFPIPCESRPRWTAAIQSRKWSKSRGRGSNREPANITWAWAGQRDL